MPAPETGIQTANERFDQFWEDIGAERLTFGDDEKGVEITVDADLSIFGIMRKLKGLSRAPATRDRVTSDERRALAEALEDAARELSSSAGSEL